MPYADMAAPLASIRNFAEAARGRRLELGLSQTQLADRAGVSRQWVSEFENGKPAAELRLVLRLFDALGLGLALEDGSTAGSERRPTVDLDALLAEHGER